jgi:hypothetical protein
MSPTDITSVELYRKTFEIHGEQTVKQHHHVNFNIEMDIIKYGINITDGRK